MIDRHRDLVMASRRIDRDTTGANGLEPLRLARQLPIAVACRS